VAGFGLVANPEDLARRGLRLPQRWRDLASPSFAGLVTLPVAGKVGFSPTLYDVLLQGEGWADGWALLSEIAGNARLTAGGEGLVEQVAADGGVAATIDFFVLSAMAAGRPVAMLYPAPTAFSPAHVAVMAAAPHPEAAELFERYLLSPQGQALLFDRDISRHPVRPDAYAAAAAGREANPFARSGAVTFPYDAGLGARRTPLVAALFEVAVTRRHDRLAALWQRLHRAEGAAGDKAPLARARRLLTTPPISESEAADPALLALFRDRRASPAGEARAVALEAEWGARLAALDRQVERLLPAPASGR
jgi:hypothetical protein